MSFPRVIGLTGYAQHGKNTAADVIREVQGDNVLQFGFADALRQMAATIDPFVQIVGEKPMRYSEVVFELGYEDAKKLPEVRRFLQVLGTEAVRGIIGDEAWIDALHKTLMRYDAGTLAVITDVRFRNEAHYVKDWGELWGVRRVNEDGSQFDNGVGTSHASEQYIETALEDADVLITACSTEELSEQVKRVLADGGA